MKNAIAITDRREFLKTVGFACAGAVWVDGLSHIAGASPSLPTGDAAKKPNIILIMTDDQGWGETGYYKHPALKTPNLDAMGSSDTTVTAFTTWE